MNLQPEITVKNLKTGESLAYRMDQPSVVIGRDQNNFIVLPSKTVSRRHAEILHDRHQFFVRDLKSNNGTRLGSRLLPPREKNLLKPGDIIHLEDFDIHFEMPDRQGPDNTDPDLLEVKMVKKLLRTLDKESAPSLEILDGPEQGRRFLFEARSQDVVVGRDPACELYIESPVISRKHARFEKRFDTVTLHDLESKNGTFVNQEKAAEKRLQDGDVVHLGTLALMFRNPQELGLDLEPPELSSREAETSDSRESTRMIAVSDPKIVLPEARVAKRRTEKDPIPPPREEVYENPPPAASDASPDTTAPRLSVSEIVMVVVGLTVLVGSLWGLIRVLK